jgi:uncharacterized protein YcnI
MRRILRAALTTGAVSVVGVLGFAGAAQAHVTVNPSDAAQGGYARVAFRVPPRATRPPPRSWRWRCRPTSRSRRWP